jgi:hypothetical protein
VYTWAVVEQGAWAFKKGVFKKRCSVCGLAKKAYEMA